MTIRFESHFTAPSTVDAALVTASSFVLPKSTKPYAQQYANLYYLRLIQLRQQLKLNAHALWSNLPTSPKLVDKVLDVQTGRLSWIMGTVYMDMHLKPNILADLAREHYVAAPPPRRKFYSDADEVMLEDESGRVRLVGERIANGAGSFVTGTIMAVLGAETPSGDFEVAELCYAGLPPQPPSSHPLITSSDTNVASQANAMQVDEENHVTATKNEDDQGEWVAIVSGLEMGSANAPNDLKAQLLVEWLVGELGDDDDQRQSMKITKLILAGNSLSQPTVVPAATLTSTSDDKKPKRYGYDSTLYSAEPTAALDTFLSSILASLDVDLMPGESDPTGPTMPQQPLHRALFPTASSMSNPSKPDTNGRGKGKSKEGEAVEGDEESRRALGMKTNPNWSHVDGMTVFGHSGQPLDDIFKYLATEDRIEMAAATLEWSHVAPTCPDTLWCYPFSSHDPFILHQTPHVYFIGNQPAFATRVVSGKEGQRCRIVLVPKFSETGEVICVRPRDGEVKVVRIEL